jgi:hypothetical protein
VDFEHPQAIFDIFERLTHQNRNDSQCQNGNVALQHAAVDGDSKSKSLVLVVAGVKHSKSHEYETGNGYYTGIYFHCPVSGVHGGTMTAASLQASAAPCRVLQSWTKPWVRRRIALR